MEVEVEVYGRCMHASRGKWTVDEAKEGDIGISDERDFLFRIPCMLGRTIWVSAFASTKL